MNYLRWLLSSVAAAILALGVSACEREGPVERTGEEIDRGIEDAGDELEDATE